VLPDEVGFVGLGLGLIGVVALFRADRSVFMGTLLLFLTCVAYSINYDIHDIDSYFLLAYVTLVVWAGIGACVLIAWMRNTFRWSQAVVSTVIVGFGLVPLAYHYTRVDESKDYLVEDYTMNMFSSLKPQAVVLSYQWDYWVSASYYYQLVRGMRPDLVVIDKELLRRSWYLLELEQRFPWLMQQSAPEVEAFRKELYKFEHELPYDPNIIQARFVDMIRSFIDKNMSIRPVYVTNEIEPEFTGALQRVPEGLALRLASDTLFHSSKPPEFTYRPFGREGRLEGMVPHLYGQALILRGIYYYNRGKDLGEARRSWKLALRYDPSSEQGRRLLGQFGGP